MLPPDPFYPNNHCSHTRDCDFLALRDLLSKYPLATSYSSESLAELLYELRYVSLPPAVYHVEEVLEALRVEGEVLA